MRNYWPICMLLVLLCACDKEEDISKSLPDEVTFTHLPTDLSEMQAFGPIGQIRVIPKSHGGFYVAGYSFEDPDIPVYAMSDGIIYNIRYEQLNTGDHQSLPPEIRNKDYDDFTLEIYLTKTAKMHYGHLSRLGPEIIEAAGSLQFGRGVENRVNIPVEAGQVIAYIGRHPGFDIGLQDTKRQAYFANPSRYSPEYMGSLPFTDFLTPVLRQQIWDINPRTVEPRGGQVAYDVEGALSGNWFLVGTTSLLEWSKQLVIARHELRGDRITIADGSPLSDGDGKLNDGKDSNIWWIKGNAPDPASITVASGKVKYEVADYWRYFTNDEAEGDGTAMFELTGEDRLNFEYFEGKLPVEVNDFTSGVKVYER